MRGFELDGRLQLGNVRLQAAYASTDGQYVSFTNAPLPLEEVGSVVAFKDISGGRLPGISKHALSLGGEYFQPVTLFENNSEFFVGVDSYYRSEFSSSPSPSQFLNVDSYAIANARVGLRAGERWAAYLWARNLFDKNYFEQLLPGAGNAGHYAAVLGDPRTWGGTLRYTF